MSEKNDKNHKTKLEKHVSNYVTTNRFYVEMGSNIKNSTDKTIIASFSECSGLGMQIKKNVFHEGGVNDQQRIYLGQAEFSDVTLKRGMTDDQEFLEWIISVSTLVFTRRNVNILVFNQAGETMMSWTLIGAIPVAWKTPALQADGNAVAIEELTLAYEGLKVGKDKGGGNQTLRTKLGHHTSN